MFCKCIHTHTHTCTPRDRHAHSKLKREGEWERERETLTQSHASMPLAYNETNIAVAAKKKMYSHTAATSVVITWLWLHTVLVQWCWALIAVEQPHENSKLYRCSHIPFSFKFRWTVSFIRFVCQLPQPFIYFYFIQFLCLPNTRRQLLGRENSRRTQVNEKSEFLLVYKQKLRFCIYSRFLFQHFFLILK